MSDARALCLVALLLASGCELFFGSGSETDPLGSGAEVPGTQPPGAECSEYGDRCVPGAQCLEVGGPQNRESVCVKACTPGGSDCPVDTRCTSTPDGAICLARCAVADDCGNYSPLLCIQTGTPGDGVCYPDGATSGEVVPKASIAVVRVTVKGPSGSPGLEPGRTAKVSVEIRNVGSRKLKDLTSIVEKRSELIEDVQGAASGPYSLGLDAEMTVASVDVSVAADAPAGAPLPLVLHLKDGASGAQFDLDVALRLEKALARLAVSRVELTRQGNPVASLADGQPTRVKVYAQNIGLTSTQGAAVSVTLSPGVVGTLEPSSLSYVPPGSEQVVAEGNLTASGPAWAELTFTATNLQDATERVSLP